MKKKSFFKAVVLCCIGAGITACGSNKPMSKAIDLNGEWDIVAINGANTQAEHTPYIGLDMASKRVYGNAGYNRMMGSFEVDSTEVGKIRFNQIATTRMMCPDMETESSVLEALDKVAGYTEAEQGIALTDSEGKVLLTLAKREMTPSTLADLEGEWLISAINGNEMGQTENIPFLVFDTEEKRIHGNTGCNIVNGGFSQEEGVSNSLKFAQLISTMMACPDMSTERLILEALDKTTSFVAHKHNQTITLLDENGTEVLTLTSKEE